MRPGARPEWSSAIWAEPGSRSCRTSAVPDVREAHSSRGAAFGDFDNDGDVDILIINLNEPLHSCATT